MQNPVQTMLGEDPHSFCLLTPGIAPLPLGAYICGFIANLGEKCEKQRLCKINKVKDAESALMNWQK